MQPPNQCFSLSAKMNGTKSSYYELLMEHKRRALVRMHCMYCSMAKGTSRAKQTLNSEKLVVEDWTIIYLLY